VEIKHAVEMPDGTYTYQGVLSGPELKFLVEYAINNLMMTGAFPFIHEDTIRDSLSPYPDEVTEQ
jgi:hypothetical protein